MTADAFTAFCIRGGDYEHVIASAGGALRDAMRVDVFIKDMEYFKIIHEVRSRHFDQNPPASTMVEVSAFTHPDLLIEIHAIAVRP